MALGCRLQKRAEQWFPMSGFFLLGSTSCHCRTYGFANSIMRVSTASQTAANPEQSRARGSSVASSASWQQFDDCKAHDSFRLVEEARCTVQHRDVVIYEPPEWIPIREVTPKKLYLGNLTEPHK
jgi:hypothetical protein